jgi:hypothetical protein
LGGLAELEQVEEGEEGVERELEEPAGAEEEVNLWLAPLAPLIAAPVQDGKQVNELPKNEGESYGRDSFELIELTDSPERPERPERPTALVPPESENLVAAVIPATPTDTEDAATAMLLANGAMVTKYASRSGNPEKRCAPYHPQFPLNYPRSLIEIKRVVMPVRELGVHNWASHRPSPHTICMHEYIDKP